MSSFFTDEDDSDAERVGKQRRNLEIIQADALKEVKERQPNERIDEAPGQLSEEQELKRLRENFRYQQYAAGKKRNLTPSPEASKRPRPRTTVEESESDADDEKGFNPKVHEECHSSILEKITLETNSKADTIARELEASHETEEVSGARPAPHAKPKPRRGPKIDPKIIDDSSDDDSASVSSCDGSSDDAPIGPVLPCAEEPREEAQRMLESLPIQNEAILGDNHDSYVSSISIDRAGIRLATGSIDSAVMLWDFNTMTRSLRSFKRINPLDQAPVRSLQYSATGGLLLCAGGTNSAVILDRDGVVLSQTTKGDMYIVDMARTKGHTGSILSAKWRPNSKVIATTSMDGTIRLWDVMRTTRNPMVDNPVISQLRVTKLRNARGGKTAATAMDWLFDGKSCVTGCSDGRIRVIDPDAYSMRPVDESQGVVQQGAEISSVSVAPETSTAPLILVRSTDDFLRVFDRRKLTEPVKEIQSLPNCVSETNTCFVGENGRFFSTGTSAKRKDGSFRGSLRLFEARTLKEIWKSKMDVDTGSVVHTTWHENTNQIIYGSADGKVRVLYHPIESKKGVLSCLTKSDFRKKHGVANVGVGEVFLPSTLHKHRSGRSKGAATNETGDQNLPMSNRGRREASEALKPKSFSGPRPTQREKSRSLAKHLAAGEVAPDWTLDPREAILRYAEVAKKDPKFTTAYRETQPETLLAEKTAEQEEEETRQAIYERDRLRRAKMPREQRRED